MEKVKQAARHDVSAKLRTKKSAVVSGYPPFNASSDIWFVLQEAAKRTGIGRLKELLLDDAPRLMPGRQERVFQLASELMGTCQIAFDSLDDFLIVYDLCNAYMVCLMLHERQVMLTELDWETVQSAIGQERPHFYTGNPISSDDFGELVSEAVIRQNMVVQWIE